MTSFPPSFPAVPSSIPENIYLDDPAASVTALGYLPRRPSSWPTTSAVHNSDLHLTNPPPPEVRAYARSITSPPLKKARNRNTVRIECKPCKQIFTRICVYRAHLKTRKHAVNSTLSDIGISLKQIASTTTAFDRSSQLFAPTLDDSTLSGSTVITPPTDADLDRIESDFSFDWNALSDYSSSGSESPGPITIPPGQWNTLPEVPVEATLSIVGASGQVVHGFYYTSTNLFIPNEPRRILRDAIGVSNTTHYIS